MHLYLHVPFCARRCSYCDFSIAVRKRIPVGEYVDALRREVEIIGPLAGPLETIYFGGGTPSLLPPDAIRTILLDVVSSTPSLDGVEGAEAVEVTLEANPEDVTPDNAQVWSGAGVNRVSLGSQSFDDRVLEWMHRSHDAARIGAAVRTLREAGIDNISLDLIFGLPAELHRDWARDLDQALALEPAHLSLYGLTVESRTPLARWISRGATTVPEEDRYADEYLAAHAALGARGFQFYEVSNAARDGRRSRHNSAYWSGRPYRGLGPAAHSFDGRARRWNRSAWEAYRAAVAAGTSPVESEEVLTDAQRDLERLYLALRTSDGLSTSDVPPDRLTAWVDQGWVVIDTHRARCTPEGWLRLDALVRDLTGGRALA
jgi:putative oxygen-independent coproporphyrinogen III oxidase